jgi:hypothetical protein
MGKPLDFSKTTFFQEWLQLSRTQPIDRTNDAIKNTKEVQKEKNKNEKSAIVHKFVK